MTINTIHCTSDYCLIPTCILNRLHAPCCTTETLIDFTDVYHALCNAKRKWKKIGITLGMKKKSRRH